ncbi:Presequence protease, mitochondrial [Dinochytrium kinnereticum]|nr:Presequence protease, mitochondrial [Dinochytrium kinnereticum]
MLRGRHIQTQTSLAMRAASLRTAPSVLAMRGVKDQAGRLRSFASAVGDADAFVVGAKVHGYEVLQRKRIDDFDLTAVRLKHLKTGADHLHIFKEDSNNVFNVAFQTAPTDSTGVPHILEHTALCGSEKFPVRDPFFKMLNRSVATYMNALTGSDVTMYPFSTENPKDFYNLMNIYMDATLQPRLRGTDFRQEGWRLEHEDPKDPATPIVFKGVVYNEMKGVFSDVNNIFLTRLQQVFYPGTTYSHVSGGHPDAITDLTHDQLVEFHRRHYHPSNSKFFTYGNFPLTEHLRKIDERISSFEKLPPIVLDGLREYSEPKRIVETCPFDPMGDPERQVRLSITYLANDGTETFETFAMQILSTLLVDGAASPFYKELIETNIGTDYAPSTGYDRTAKETSFSIGLQGIKESDVERVENKIYKVFETLANTGFPKERVESALHQLELGIRHRKANFGMGLGQYVIHHWIHGGSPIEAMEISQNIQKLREALNTPGFFEERIRKYFLENRHRLIFIMKPSETYSVQVEESEKKRLDEKVAALSVEDKETLFKDGLELLKIQEAPEDLSCLPTVTLADIPKKGKTYPFTEHTLKASSVPLQIRETATNGVSYIRINKSLKNLPEPLVPFLSLYSGVMIEIGFVGSKLTSVSLIFVLPLKAFTALGTKVTPSLADLDERIRLISSGISASTTFTSLPTSPHDFTEQIQFSTSALDSKMPQVFPLLSELIRGADFSHPEVFERLRTVIAGAAAGGMSSLAHNGHRYAAGAASAGLKRVLGRKEVVGGLRSVVFLDGLVARGDDGVAEVLENVKAITEYLLKEQNMVKAALNGVSESVAMNEAGLAEMFSSLGWSSVQKPESSAVMEPEYQNTFYAFPFSVNYTGQAFLGVPYSHEDSPKLQALAELLTHRFLHREVREKGGAYGAFAGYNALEGVFTMASYRDPPGAGVRTMDAFKRGVEWAGNISKNVSESELNEAKMSLLSGQDAPISASEEAMTRYGTGVTDEMRQARRDLIFDLDLKSIEAVAERYLTKPSSKAILGPRQEADGLQSGDWNVLDFSKGGGGGGDE